MLEEKLTFCMKINEEIITVTCLLILMIYGVHDQLDFLGENSLDILDYFFLGVFIYGILIEVLFLSYNQLGQLKELCGRIKIWCCKNKVGQVSDNQMATKIPAFARSPNRLDIHQSELKRKEFNSKNKPHALQNKILTNDSQFARHSERAIGYGVPAEEFTPQKTKSDRSPGLKRTASRPRKKIKHQSTKAILPVSITNHSLRSLSPTMITPIRIRPPTPHSLELDIQPMQSYRKFEEQSISVPPEIDRPLNNAEMPKISDTGLKKNETLKSRFASRNRLESFEPLTLGQDYTGPFDQWLSRAEDEVFSHLRQTQISSAMVLKVAPEARMKNKMVTQGETICEKRKDKK